jgi:thymidylate synthase (FAD)
MSAQVQVLDKGYVRLVEHWGSDERIIESARMSTQKGFLGWGPIHSAPCVNDYGPCICTPRPGDEKLLKFLWDQGHHTPFEMAGFAVEVKAPIMVFREWHRHRTQSYNEMSARYAPLPDESYVPTLERLMVGTGSNKQAAAAHGAVELLEDAARDWLKTLELLYGMVQTHYESGLQAGVPKELARLALPVGRYSVMRAATDLRNWLAFLKLRCAPNAQWEIRQYANAVAGLVREHFPRTYEVARESVGAP